MNCLINGIGSVVVDDMAARGGDVGSSHRMVNFIFSIFTLFRLSFIAIADFVEIFGSSLYSSK